MKTEYVNCIQCGHSVIFDADKPDFTGGYSVTCPRCKISFSFMKRPPLNYDLEGQESLFSKSVHTASVEAPNVIDEYVKDYTSEIVKHD